MSVSSNLSNSLDITKLLTSDHTIDDNDVDFKCILQLLEQLSDYDINTALHDSYSKKIIDSERCKVMASTNQTIPQSNKRKQSSLYDENLANNNHKNAKGGIEIFPIKLFKILERSEIGGYSSLISWLPHGQAFKIHNEDLFKEHIMKKYFFQTELKSLKHQLYVYGFR